MVAIRPFKALMYDPEEIQGGLEQVTSLPYDVLTPDEVERLKKASEHNVTHLTLPSPAPGKESATKYPEANKLLKRWRKEGVLYQRSKESFFLYEITYHDGERERTARGLCCLLGLDPEYKDVRPHERTHKGPIADRFELLKATAMDLEPIQFLYRDPEDEVLGRVQASIQEQETAPVIDFTDPSGTRHVVWSVKHRDTLEAVSRWFAERKAYIADGHHRYATALHYADWRRGKNAGDEDGPARYEHKLAVLMEAGDPGLSVHPTHRLVSLDDPASARERLRNWGPVQELQVEEDPKQRAQTILGHLQDAGDAHRFVFDWGEAVCDVVNLEPGEVPASIAPERTEAWRRLDVSVLHHHVLPETLGVTQENAGERLRYTRDPLEAVTAALQGTADCTVLMNATPQHAVLEIADAGEHMPQKSTYFLPKLQSGLFFSPL